jgi:calcineurin-like phosphoesterase family protein
LTADWHLGHQRIVELSGRPFRSVDEMNAVIIRRHNDVVGEDDALWILGDVCMGSIDESLALISELRCRKVYLVAGNHDRCFHGYGDNAVNRPQLDAWVARYRRAGFNLVETGYATLRRGFGSLLELAPTTFGTDGRRRGGIVVELSHFPTVGESQSDRADRYVEYRPRPLGGVDRRATTRRWVACGHVHEAWLTRARNVNVGVDQWDFGPVHHAELARLIQSREDEYGSQLDPEHDLITLGPGRAVSGT